MSNQDTPSARETLSKIADELQARVMQAAVKAVEEAAGQPLAPPAAPQAPIEPVIPGAPSLPVATDLDLTSASTPGIPLIQTAPPIPSYVEPPTHPMADVRTNPDARVAVPEGPSLLAPHILAQPAAPTPPPFSQSQPQVQSYAAPVAPAPRKAAKAERPKRSMFGVFMSLVALAAIGTALYQTYTFRTTLDAIQRTASRGDFVGTCRDIIDTYYLVRQKIGVMMPAADRGNIVGAARVTEAMRTEAQDAVARFNSLTTYIGTFGDAAARARYADLGRALSIILENARSTQLADIDKTFDPANKLLAQTNDDCLKLARGTGG